MCVHVYICVYTCVCVTESLCLHLKLTQHGKPTILQVKKKRIITGVPYLTKLCETTAQHS